MLVFIINNNNKKISYKKTKKTIISVTYPPLLAQGSKLRAFGAPLSIIVSIFKNCDLTRINQNKFKIF